MPKMKSTNGTEVIGWLGSSGYQTVLHSSAPKAEREVKQPLTQDRCSKPDRTEKTKK